MLVDAALMKDKKNNLAISNQYTASSGFILIYLQDSISLYEEKMSAFATEK